MSTDPLDSYAAATALAFTPDLTLISRPCSVQTGFGALLSMYNGNTPPLPSLVGKKPESFRNCNQVVVVRLVSTV
jgi:hypothetical protein